jgi:hypothetical protein
MDINQVYLDSSKKQFLYYKTIAEKAMDQIEPEQLFVSYTEDSNSIAIIVKHIWGNMLSRWTDFLTTDGEKPWRERDAEFENDWSTKAELLLKWNEAWDVYLLRLIPLNQISYPKSSISAMKATL